MKFFIPHESNESEAEKIYQSIKAQYGNRITNRRIHEIHFLHDGKPFTATVGQLFFPVNEPIIAILEADPGELYFLCSPNRGVVNDSPILAGSIQNVIDFEP